MNRESPDQEALIRAAQNGDAQAFEALLEKHYDRIYRFACKWCGNPIDAQDIAQQACIKLARSLNQFRFESTFTTWLYRVVVTCAMDWQRSEARHQHDADETVEISTVDNADSGIYLRQILTRLERWGEGFKSTVLLVLGEGLSHAETAQVLKVKESTISWRIHEIRKKLNLLAQREGGCNE